jgi:ABC-type bacteriocin/lantibiotic exporter with double-glycine peptidase domain
MEPRRGLRVIGLQAVIQSLVILLGLAAGSGLVRGERPTRSWGRPRPSAHRIEEVPLAEGARDWCGPAALAAVLQYHGEETTAEEIARDIYLPGYRGSLNIDLLVWARKRGFEVWADAGSRERIMEAVCRDRPVICMVRKSGTVADRNHFVVVRGYDEGRGVLFVDGGEGREEVVGWEGFEREWGACGRWMLVAEGRQRVGDGAKRADE